MAKTPKTGLGSHAADLAEMRAQAKRAEKAEAERDDLRAKLAEELKESVRHEDEAIALRVKLSAAEADHRKTMDLAAERLVLLDAALARVKALEEELGRSETRANSAHYSLARVAELQEFLGNAVGNCERLGLALTKAEARISELEGALRESADALEELEGHYCYRMIDMTKDGVTGPGKCDYCDVADAAVDRARRVLNGDANEG
jgi:chromosome segregation ATPase